MGDQQPSRSAPLTWLIHSAENQLLKALPKMEDGASRLKKLKQAIRSQHPHGNEKARRAFDEITAITGKKFTGKHVRRCSKPDQAKATRHLSTIAK